MECRILFNDYPFDHFDWCKLEEGAGQVSESGSAEVAELNAITRDASSVLVFLGQRLITQTTAQLPPRASKQQLNAIAYSVEEQLAEDIEECFFATSTQAEDGSIAVMVIKRELMDEMTALLSEQHVQARYIVPQSYLCPWRGDADVLASENG